MSRASSDGTSQAGAVGRHDVVVLGGGPAGVAAAAGLAALGQRVALIGAHRPFAAIEGVSDRSLAALESAGCAEAISRVGPEVRRTAVWNGIASEANRERLVDRRAFDEGLWRDARKAGAAVIEARIKTVEEHSDGWRVHARGKEGGPIRIEGGFLVEARGRAAPARSSPGGRRGRRGPATTALVRRWRLPLGGAAKTAVAAFPDGWCWFVSPGEGLGLLQIFVSSAPGELPPRRDLASFYRALIARIPEAGGWLQGAKAEGAVEARNAAPRMAGELLGPRFVRAGDAAFAVDPLSGQGIFQALALGLALPAVVNTLIRRPDDRALAEAFYRERVEESFLRMSRIGRDFYDQETRWRERDFWRHRRAWPDRMPAHAAADVAAPFVAERPVSEAGLIVRRPVIVTADHPRGIWRIAEVPLLPLVSYFAETRGSEALGSEIGEAVARYGTKAGHTPEAVETALSWLVQRGLLLRDGQRIGLHPAAGAKLLDGHEGGTAER